VFVSRIRAGDWVEVLSAGEIKKTLDRRGCLEGLPFMPEMLTSVGRVLRVRQRAERTCVHPPQGRFPQLSGCLTLAGLRCDGSAHAGCQLGCALIWKEAWLRRLEGPDAGPRADIGEPVTTFPSNLSLPTMSGQDPRTYTCQGTELVRATTPGDPLWKPVQYLRFVRDRTYAPAELVGVFGRIASRRLAGLVPFGDASRAGSAGDGALGLRPGEWVKVKSRREIQQTLGPTGKLTGLAFGGDMTRDCGRVFRVRERVEQIIDERNGRVRAIADTVILEGSICDRYLGCARRMPILWREAWLQRVEAPGVASRAVGRPARRRLT
jgi:hypothetical protein